MSKYDPLPEQGDNMSKFSEIEPENIQVWFDEVTKRIVAKATLNGEWHKVAFRVGFHGTMQEMIDVLKEDLREPKS